MNFRYKLQALKSEFDPRSLLTSIQPCDGMFRGGGAEDPWNRVCDLLARLGAKTLLVQTAVRDPDYLEEYEAFYAKQHTPVNRDCIRVHAFKSLADDSDDPAQIMRYLDAQESADTYLGFVTLRPLRHAPVGATILVPLEGESTTVTDKFPVHIAGNKFNVRGTPFLQQDSAVGACAQASIWMALRVLRRKAGNSAFSTAELTLAATRYVASNRVFPGREGLRVEQMLEAVRFAGHDPLHVVIRRKDKSKQPADRVLRSAVPYIESGLPVIFSLSRDRNDDGHAVVAIGLNAHAEPTFDNVETSLGTNYRVSTDWVQSLIVHDDAQGPYVALRNGSSGETNNLEHAVSLIVPLPDVVFINAEEAERTAAAQVGRASVTFLLLNQETGNKAEKDFVLRVYLCPRHAFRKWAKDAPELDDTVKEHYRTTELPQHVWVAELHDKNVYDPSDPGRASRCGEIVLDASADIYHGDTFLFGRITNQLFPSCKLLAAILLLKNGKAIPLANNEPGRALRVWEIADDRETGAVASSDSMSAMNASATPPGDHGAAGPAAEVAG